MKLRDICRLHNQIIRKRSGGRIFAAGASVSLHTLTVVAVTVTLVIQVDIPRSPTNYL